jgi:hypothetical protein
MVDPIPAFRKTGTLNAAEFHLVMIEGKPGRYRLQERFQYVKPAYAAGPNDYVVSVPTNLDKFTTDLASIPFFATWLVPRDGKHTPAALLHDSLYADARCMKKDGIAAFERADWVFRGAMDVNRVPLIRRWLMWAAVSVGTFKRGSFLRALWGWTAIMVTVVTSLIFNFMWANSVFGETLAWIPRYATRVLDWAEDVRALAWLPDDLRWVPSLTKLNVLALVLASCLLWHRQIIVALVAAGAVMLFGFPLMLAAWSFGIYWLIELFCLVCLRLANKRANDIGILRRASAPNLE